MEVIITHNTEHVDQMNISSQVNKNLKAMGGIRSKACLRGTVSPSLKYGM